MIALRENLAVTQPAEPALTVAGVAHRFAGRWVLRGCDLEIRRGEAVALLGGNGAGKTTLLRVISTLLRPTRGSVRVLGHDLATDAAGIRGRIGVMSFNPALYEDLTAAENLRFACRMRGEKADNARIARVLDEVGLARHADVRVRGYSSGMRRRVALARVLLHTPELLLLDEPYAALDDEGAERINDVIQAVIGRGGAVLAATHDLPRAAAVMHRVLRLEAGLLREVCMAEELEAPAAVAALWQIGTFKEVRWQG
jgi:heme exporter protein A